jgi:phenylacetyl-CoA:acceptor oxidoreductase subunit 1
MLNPDRSAGAAGKRYGMTIDVNRCVGCQTCTIACKHANDTGPDIQWRQVIDIEQGEYPNVERFFLVTGCQHCAEPPCVPVCPSGATYQRPDGLVVMDYDRCIGCASCAVACPYQARTIAHEMGHYYASGPTLQEMQVAHPERIGVAQKCTFCIDRIDEAHERGLEPGVDLEVTPACAASCISQAIKFGDFNDPQSEVSRLVRERASFQINDFLNTDPQIRYLYEVPDAIPGKPAAPPSDEELRDPNNPLAGKLQRFWDYRAAMNFIMGGTGSGLLMVAAAMAAVGSLPVEHFATMVPVAAAIIAVGLFFVLIKIGRPLRALNVMLRPGTSWMSREVYAVAVLFPLMAMAWYRPSLALVLAVGAAAAAFLYCQAQILYASKGIPAWRAPLIPAMLFVTGLSEGTGLYALLSALLWPERSLLPLALPMLTATAAALWLWRSYVASARENGIPPLARDVLEGLSPYYSLALLVALAGASIGLWFALPAVEILSGATIVVAGAAWKFAVITRASYQQGFVLPKVPQRGSGKYAAPHRMNGLVARSGVERATV